MEDFAVPKVELLAPAGGREALRAAVCAGADAVYLGYSAFSARASAVNFDGEQLSKAVQYAHFHHVRVYAAVNILVKEEELEAVYGVLQTIQEARADAVIVQDLGVAVLARRYFPTLEVHASTQMALHNATGVAWAKEMGFTRVVLARECGIREIAKAAAQGAEVEVFVHGALCAGVSGQCLMSSMAGGRSGNRGRCAQPCRQSFRLGKRGGALLSLRDLCLREQLPGLMKAGVHALKIEGRLKRPEYVAVVVDSYRRAIDRLTLGEPPGNDPAEREWLMQAFHRGGFTKGHAGGDEDAKIADPGRVGHGGVLIGRVVKAGGGLAMVKLSRDLRDGDGVQLRASRDIDLRYSGKDKEAGEEAILRLRPGESARPGDEVARLTDVRQMAWVSKLCQERPVPVTLRAWLRPEQAITLSAEDGAESVTVRGQAAEVAKTRPITRDEVWRRLSRLGDTGFCLAPAGEGNVDMEGNLFVPVGSLNALRREAVEALAKARAAAFFGKEKEQWLAGHPPVEWSELPEAKGHGGNEDAKRLSAPSHSKPHTAPFPVDGGPVVRFQQPGLAQAFLEEGASLLIFAPWDVRPRSLEEVISLLPPGVWLELPPVLTQASLEAIQGLVRINASRLGGVVAGSVGQLGAAFPVPVALGGGVPVTNRLALAALERINPAFFILWPEWSFGDWKGMPWGCIPRLWTVYGRERVMLLHHCPERTARGFHDRRQACALCEGGHMACGERRPELIDGKGFRFPVSRILTPEGCVLALYNALPTDLSRHEDKRRALGAGKLVSFTVEPPGEQVRILRDVVQGVTVSAEGEATAGHLLRGVE